MNNEIIRKGRFQQKCDTTADWEKAYGNFVPKKGEIIIYQDYDENKNPLPPKYKSGDGKTDIGELPFSSAGIELGEGENSIQQAGTGSKAVGIESFASGHNTTAAGKASGSTGFSNALASNNPDFSTNPVAAWHKARNRKRGMDWETGATIPGPTADQEAEYKNTALTTQERLDIIAAADYKVKDEMTEEKLDAEDYARNFTYASGLGAHTEGLNTLATGKGAHAEGSRTFAGASRAHAEGTDTSATGSNSHAEGQDSMAKGQAAHAEGFGTVAGTKDGSGGGEGAHSEGTYTKASATASHAEGSQTEARAVASHAEGGGTIATREHQHVQGRYNYLDVNGDAGDFVHIVGWGTSSARKNIHTLDSLGNAIFAGDVTSNKTSLNKLATDLNTIDRKIDTTAGEITKNIALKYSNAQTGNESGALGLGATVSARYGAALGWKCQVVGASHGFAIGAGAKVISSCQIALGKANKPDQDYEGQKAIFMVGNGETADNAEGAIESKRSNAFAITAAGTGYLGDKKILVTGDAPKDVAKGFIVSNRVNASNHAKITITPKLTENFSNHTAIHEGEISVTNTSSMGQVYISATDLTQIKLVSGTLGRELTISPNSIRIKDPGSIKIGDKIVATTDQITVKGVSDSTKQGQFVTGISLSANGKVEASRDFIKSDDIADALAPGFTVQDVEGTNSVVVSPGSIKINDDKVATESYVTNAIKGKANASNVYTKNEIDSKLGDITTALQKIIAIQNSLIGGNS